MTARPPLALWDQGPPPDTKSRWRALIPAVRTPILAAAPTVKGDDTVATLRIYDILDSWGGSWGISAREFTDTLDALPDTVSEIRLLINSPGGEVFEAIAIMNALRGHKARIVAVVEGLAASSASYIAVSADELVMAPNSEMVIHDAWGMCVGNQADMLAIAGQLGHLSDNMASIYAGKAGGDAATWRAAMATETWYSAEEAVSVGLADRVDSGAEPPPGAKATFDLSVFKFSGRQQAPGPQQHPATGPGDGDHQPERSAASMDFTAEQLTDLRARYGLADDADEAAVQAAIVAAPAAPSPAPVHAALPAGIVAIDEATLADLQAAAADGRTARAAQVAEHREGLVKAAIADGRIPPARKDAWLAQLAADPGAESVLTALAKGTIPVAASTIGTAGEQDLDSDEALWAELYGTKENKA